MADNFESRLAAAEFFADRAADLAGDAVQADDDSVSGAHEASGYLRSAGLYAQLAEVNLGLHRENAGAPWFGESQFERRLPPRGGV